MKKKSLWIGLLVFVLVLGGAYLLYQQLAPQFEQDQLAVQTPSGEPNPTGETDSTSATEGTAPDFIVYDHTGSAHRLSDYFGKPIVLNFWASWCGPCRSEMAHFEKLYRETGENIHFLLVNQTDGTRETVKTASEYVNQNGYTFPVLYDTEFNAAATYGINSLPWTFFIASDGSIKAWARSALNEESLRRGISLIWENQ